ncbi:MAG: hypothetical protein WCJ25_00140 [Candidatus Moraniibacteriota bacterium]
MVPQTIEYLNEKHRQGTIESKSILYPFIFGMRWFESELSSRLIYSKDFSRSKELKVYDIHELIEAIDELSFALDVNFSYQEILYVADFGAGLTVPLMSANRIPVRRCVSFEIEERSATTQLITNFENKIANPLVLLAIRYYSIGMKLLAMEDAEYGLMESAFMQFYLVIELLLESEKSSKAKKKIIEKGYSDENFEKIVERVYIVRNNFIGHIGKNGKITGVDQEFLILKQVLVAKWAARRIICLESKLPFYFREMWVTDSFSGGICFNGTEAELHGEFNIDGIL